MDIVKDRKFMDKVRKEFQRRIHLGESSRLEDVIRYIESLQKSGVDYFDEEIKQWRYLQWYLWQSAHILGDFSAVYCTNEHQKRQDTEESFNKNRRTEWVIRS